VNSGGRSEQGGETVAAAPAALPLVHHHHHGGVELRVTVAFPQERRAEEVAALDELESMLRGEGRDRADLSRLAGLAAPPEAPKRVFSARLRGDSAGVDLMRTLQGWMMRHRHATVTLKVDGPKGGTSLQIRRYSAVALAEAAAKIGPYLVDS
jgi:hypothetical protein